METESFEQAFRDAVFSARPAWRPILWAFLPLLRAHLSFALAEMQMLQYTGCLDADE